MNYYLYNKSNAFTLAEVLITLGIIGVVAALTIPNLIGNYKKKVLHTQFLKAYSDLNQAAKMFEVKEEITFHDFCIMHNTGSTNAEIIMDAFMKYFNGKSTQSTFRDEKFRIRTNLAGKTLPYHPCDESGTISDNSGRFFVMDDTPRINTQSGPKICVDINGNKMPNKYGYDVFVFTFTNNGVKPYIGDSIVSNVDTELSDIKQYCNYEQTAVTYSCAYFALQDTNPNNEKQNYWKDFLK